MPPPLSAPTPTPILQVWVSGKKWLVTSEYSNIAGNLAVNLVLQRIRVSGALWWQETCRWVGCGFVLGGGDKLGPFLFVLRPQIWAPHLHSLLPVPAALRWGPW
jgi:hypothetical protein